MLYNLYTVVDKLAEEAGPPFTAVNDKVAMRKFREMGIPESLKDEYEVRCLGSFDSVGCFITPEMVYTLATSEVDNG